MHYLLTSDARQQLRLALGSVIDRVWEMKVMEEDTDAEQFYMLPEEMSTYAPRVNESLFERLKDLIEENPEASFFFHLEQVERAPWWGMEEDIAYVIVYFWCDVEKSTT